MLGVPRLFALSIALLFICATVFADNKSTTDDKAATPAASAPPKAKIEVIEDTLHGKTIADPYSWLEDANNPDTQEFTRDQLAYTRSLLDKQPQMQRINARLAQLLTIGSIGAPTVRGE